MELNLWSGNSLLFPNMNVVFDDSIFQVDEDKNFSLSVNEGFNSSITFPSYAESIRITGHPYNFNTPLNIPSTVKNLYSCFAYCYNLNQSITIPSGVVNCDYMYFNCRNYNQPVIIPEGVVNCQNMFSGCYNFNQSVNIANSVQILVGMFNECYNFNQPITIPTNVLNPYDMFYVAPYNAPVTIPNGVKYCNGLFHRAEQFNQPISIPDSVINCAHMFLGEYGNSVFNSPVTLGNGVVSAVSMFHSCPMYNQPTDFKGTANIAYALYNCKRFNSPVYFNIGVENCNSLFAASFYFNRHVILPSGVTDVQTMLSGARRFNSSVVIPGTVRNMWNMFESITGEEYNFYNSKYGPAKPEEVLQQPIYLAAYSVVSASNIFGNGTSPSNINMYITGVQNNIQFLRSFRTSGTKMLNIYTDDRSMNLLYDTNLLSSGAKPTWTNDPTNGCIYNSGSNIYIYNNWDGNIPSEFGYKHLCYRSASGDSVMYDEYLESGDNGTYTYYEQNKWSNVPNGAPITGILDNITANKTVYYAGDIFPSYIRQAYGIVGFTANNRAVSVNTNGYIGSSGIVLNGQQIAGVAFKKIQIAGGNQSGHCYQNATLPSITASGTGRVDFGTPNNGHYYTAIDRDVFLQLHNGTIQAAVTYREGNVPDGGVRLLSNAVGGSNAALEITVANNSPVTLPYGDASTNVSYGGLVNVRYASSQWNVTAIAPVTDGINNYSAGQVIRAWSYSAWNALTVWPQ